mgnify:FL=1
MELKEEIKNTIAEILEMPAADLTFDMEMEDVDGWDSMRNVMILSTLEEKYDIIFPEDDIFDLTSVGALAEEVAKLKAEA